MRYLGFQNREEGPFKYSLGNYYGTYEDGVRSGKGTFIFKKDSSYYEGTWQNDNMCGYGRLITPFSYYERRDFKWNCGWSMIQTQKWSIAVNGDAIRSMEKVN